MDKTKYILLLFTAIILTSRLVLIVGQAGNVQIPVPDTYTRDTLALGESISSGGASNFILGIHKYPLLGPYLALPVVGLFYLEGKISGKFESPIDFARSYAMKETNLGLWLRFEALLINLLGILFIYLSARRFITEYKWAGIWTLVFAACSFYATAFAVQLRIHNLVFFLSALTLYLSLLYYRKPTTWNTFVAFGSAALVFAGGQSGLSAFALPITASFLAFREHRIVNLKPILIGVLIYITVSIGIGYPGIFTAIFGEGSNISQYLLSPEHSDTSISLSGLFTLLYDYISSFEFVWLWPIFVFTILAIFRKNNFKLNPHSVIALSQIVLFLLIFGTSSVTVGRFALAVLPALFYLSVFIIGNMSEKKWFMVPLVCFVFLGLFINLHMTRAAIGGDSRSIATNIILAETNYDDKIISTIDHHSLGLPSLPESTVEYSLADKIVSANEITGLKSRTVDLWEPSVLPATSVDWDKYSLVVLGKTDKLESVQSHLEREGFTLVETISPYRFINWAKDDYFNWGEFGDTSVFQFYFLNKFGPPIYIYKKLTV